MWRVSMLFRQPAVQGLRACSTANTGKSLACIHITRLDQGLPTTASVAGSPASTAAVVPAPRIVQQQQGLQDPAVIKMASAAVMQPDLRMAVSDAADAAAIQSNQCSSMASNAVNAPAVAAMATLAKHQPGQQTVGLQESGEQYQQHETFSAASTLPFNTKLLRVDPAALPAAAAPDAETAQQIMTAATCPNLSRDSCPHLYYEMPDHWKHRSNSSCRDNDIQHQEPGQRQQQLLHDHSSSSSDVEAILQAATLLRDGEPVAIPTETVYGLAGNALSATAVASIFDAKGRPADNPLIVHISDLDMLAQLYAQPWPVAGQVAAEAVQAVQPGQHDPFSYIPQQYHRLIAAFWPGPLTILLPASRLVPATVTAGHPTMAVRMPAHPVARALIAAAGVPLAAPSANTSGKPSPTTAQHVLEDLAGKVPAVVDGGGCGCGVESTVLDGLREPPVVLRPGGVAAESLASAPAMADLQVYSRDFTDKQLESTPTTPGMKYRHYSPSAPVLLLDPTAAWQQQQQQSTQQLQQAMVDATQQLLRRVQQGQLQDLLPDTAAVKRVEQVQRVVLLRSCSSSGSEEQGHGRVGWTPDSVARLQQQQQQQGGTEPEPGPLAAAEGPTGLPNSSSSSSCIEVLEYVLGDWQQPETVARQLFGALRAADRVGAQLILVQGVVPGGAGLAVMNRLQKAASGKLHVGNAPGS